MSRAELARATGLTRASISELVSNLMADGLIHEIGRGPAKVGKPSTIVGIDRASRVVACVDLSTGTQAKGALVDIGGSIGHRESAPISGTDTDEAVTAVERLVERLVASTETPVLGVGVGVPGLALEGGRVTSTRFGWRNVPLADRVAASSGLEVCVENDANAAALAEYTQASTLDPNLLLIRIGDGVGAGIVVNGEPYNGESNAAGEVGHIVVDENGPPCRCGNRGCLETFLSRESLEAAISPTAGNPAAFAIAGSHLGAALATVVKVLDIHRVIVSGAPPQIELELCRIALESLWARSLRGVGSAVNLRPSTLGEDVVLLGASAAVVSQQLGIV